MTTISSKQYISWNKISTDNIAFSQVWTPGYKVGAVKAFPHNYWT
jgi:hypothetical protein